jgi:CRISPR/Cas system-associated exonuclease Cas4 (RecB family)
MVRFDREFHQSDCEKFKLCPRMFYYREVLGIDEERISEFALAGSALHATFLKAHAEKLWEEEALFAFWKEDFEKRVADALSFGTAVERGIIDAQDYRHMLAGYLAKPWNREAEILLAEKEFFFEIKPSSTSYQFAGRLDQVISVPTELLVLEFPIVRDFPKSEIQIHRDLKTGQRKGITPFELMLNDQISIYAYGLKYGNFDLDDDGICETHLDLIPDFHALYFLHDHIPYKRPPKDKSVRGPGMYFTQRPVERLRRIPRELMPICSSIRRGDFPREGVARGLCEKHCSVRNYCEADLLQEII